MLFANRDKEMGVTIYLEMLEDAFML